MGPLFGDHWCVFLSHVSLHGCRWPGASKLLLTSGVNLLVIACSQLGGLGVHQRQLPLHLAHQVCPCRGVLLLRHLLCECVAKEEWSKSEMDVHEWYQLNWGV